MKLSELNFSIPHAVSKYSILIFAAQAGALAGAISGVAFFFICRKYVDVFNERWMGSWS